MYLQISVSKAACDGLTDVKPQRCIVGVLGAIMLHIVMFAGVSEHCTVP